MEVRLRRLLREAPASADRHDRAPVAVAAPAKIAVVGTSGAGKTTVATALAAKLQLPYVELDSLFHGPDWAPAEKDVFRERIERAIASDAWVVDGNYLGQVGTLVLYRADLIVWLDLPLRTSLWRISWRSVDRILRRRVLWAGNRETWRGAFWGRDSLLYWTITSHLARKKRWPDLLAPLNVVRLRSQREVDEWLAAL